MARKRQPLTSAQKQQNRRAALDEISKAAGWFSWNEYSTAVKHGIVKIESKPIDSTRRRG